MNVQERLLGLLADGQLHSGSELADALGVSRAAIWKHIKQLDQLELDITAQAGQGYQLSAPLELLNEADIVAGLRPDVRSRTGAPELLLTS